MNEPNVTEGIHRPVFMEEVRRLGFFCSYNAKRDQYVCASRCENGIFTGASFILCAPTHPWLLFLRSGVAYAIPEQVPVERIAIEILSGNGSNQKGTPTHLASTFVHRYGLIRSSELFLSRGLDCEVVQDAESIGPPIQIGASEFAQLIHHSVDTCAVSRNVVRVSLGNETCEIGFKANRATRRVLPIVLFGEFRHTEEQRSLLRALARSVLGVVFSELGLRLDL